MPRTGNDGLLNVCRNVTHDHGLQCAKGLLAPNSQHGHRQLRLLEDFIVLRVLGERSELRKAGTHSSRLRIGCSKKVSRGLVGFARITRKVVPNAIKIDTFAACNKPFRVRTMKVEMPNTRIQEYFVPWFDPGNRSVHYNQPFN